MVSIMNIVDDGGLLVKVHILKHYQIVILVNQLENISVYLLEMVIVRIHIPKRLVVHLHVDDDKLKAENLRHVIIHLLQHVQIHVS